MWSLILSLLVPVAWAPDAVAAPFCGWQANFPGTRGAHGFTITAGVEAMPRSLLVRTTVGTPATVSRAVNEAIAAINVAGAGWARGPDVDRSTAISTADRRRRPPRGELWVVGNPDAYPSLPKGTYTSSVPERVGNSPVMPLSTIVVLSSSLGGSTLPHERRVNAVLHEFGHAAGLDHHFAPWGGECQLMSYRGGTALGAGDLAGLRLLAQRSPTRPPWGNPFGNLDVVRRTGDSVLVAGWAIDPDQSASIAVHIYVDGRYRTAVTANARRSDVARVVPGASANHGFNASLRLPTRKPAVVCAYAINIGVGSANPLLGCAVASP